MSIQRITPVLLVREVEPCVAFWVDILGFKKIAEVPDGNRLGFVILERDGLEIMYQSFRSAEKDAPEAAREINGGRTFLYIEVDRLESIREATTAADVVIPLRDTAYGAKEIGVKDPAGHVIVFAEMTAQPQS
ncbi:MAG TPA: VOC family protein [Terriglobales bacterium]